MGVGSQYDQLNREENDLPSACRTKNSFYNKEGTKFRDQRRNFEDNFVGRGVEPKRAVPWTKPEDWEVDLEHPRRGNNEATATIMRHGAMAPYNLYPSRRRGSGGPSNSGNGGEVVEPTFKIHHRLPARQLDRPYLIGSSRCAAADLRGGQKFLSLALAHIGASDILLSRY